MFLTFWDALHKLEFLYPIFQQKYKKQLKIKILLFKIPRNNKEQRSKDNWNDHIYVFCLKKSLLTEELLSKVKKAENREIYKITSINWPIFNRNDCDCR